MCRCPSFVVSWPRNLRPWTTRCGATTMTSVNSPGLPGPPLLEALVADLGPRIPWSRDEAAYGTAVRWIPGLDAAERGWLGDRMAGLFDDPGVQARASPRLSSPGSSTRGTGGRSGGRRSPGGIPARPICAGTTLCSAGCMPPRTGLICSGPSRGARSRNPRRCSNCAVARLLAGTEQVFDAQEDDRIARALARILCRPGLSAGESVGSAGSRRCGVPDGEPGPVPPWASNTMRTLRTLYLLADRGLLTPTGDGPPSAVTHREAVLDALAATLAIVTPGLPSLSGRDQL